MMCWFRYAAVDRLINLVDCSNDDVIFFASFDLTVLYGILSLLKLNTVVMFILNDKYKILSEEIIKRDVDIVCNKQNKRTILAIYVSLGILCILKQTLNSSRKTFE